jgi:hypothetical protein
MMTPLGTLLKEGAFEFQMGLRRGSEEFFRNHPEDREVLAERRRWLAAEPHRYAAQTPGAEPLIEEAIGFARRINPSFAADSLLGLGKEWAPDFLLLRAAVGGEFQLVAGCVCFPSHWAIEDKIGRPLAAIHEPVPTLHAALGAKIDTFLANLRPDAVWERWNWGLAATAELNNHPSRTLPQLDAHTPIEACWFRAEHQVFRLLPETRGILFAIRIHLTPLTVIGADLTLAPRLAKALESMPPGIAAYKGLAAAREALAALLAAGHRTR